MLATKRLHKSDRVAVMHLDQLLDEALQETFPASDSIAVAIEPELPRLEANLRASGAAASRLARSNN